jgi:D-glutamate cyclase
VRTDLLSRLRDVIQVDVGHRGLAHVPDQNLFTYCCDDLANACHSIANTSTPRVGIVTGFYIPTATPPAGETDGPLGAVFLARALTALGVEVALFADDWLQSALAAGLEECRLNGQVRRASISDLLARHASEGSSPTHLIALERVGPCHTHDADHPGRYRNMRGVDVTEYHAPAHLLFEPGFWPTPLTTIGIGDGGNEIGMGKIPWEVIARNIPNGERIACRIATDHLIVAGVSNWGACALAAGVCSLRGAAPDGLFDAQTQERVLRRMVEDGPLVDGTTGVRAAIEDGLPFARHAEMLEQLEAIVRAK